MPRKLLLAGLAAIVILVAAIAWVNGGPQELRDIALVIEVPETAR